MADRFTVCLTEEQQHLLDTVIRHRRCSPTLLVRALVLRAANVAAAQPPRTDEEIAQQVHVSTSTVYRVRKRFVEGGIECALLPRRADMRFQIAALAD
jgi:methylphosphotriester-DNA--protein-cysteine methyltransferase